MTGRVLGLPFDVPWKVIAVSPDMIDVLFCNKKFPTPWRSSVAISAYEPPDEDQPEGLCGRRVAFLKITCSITGYQPSEAEVTAGYVEFGTESEEVERVLTAYFGCYGVLLNVSVHRNPPIVNPQHQGPIDPREVDTYPIIVDFEPKTRDLYQMATESGEVLTASKEEVGASKTLTVTGSLETGVSVTTGHEAFPGGKATTTRARGDSAQDSVTTHRDHSRDRSERQGTSTNISQLYNLLTGYHAGTNRAAFLMLPRPHTMQSTDHRTFIQGLRVIEGIQEFFLVVSQPAGQGGMSIEVSLETAHLSEEAVVEPEPQRPEEGTVTTDFLITDRNLCARYRMRNGCPNPEPIEESQIVPDPEEGGLLRVVHEDRLTLRAPMASAFGQRASVLPALKELLRRVQFTMTTAAHSRYRRAVVGGVGYLDTDYVSRRLRSTIPRTRAGRPPKAGDAPARLRDRPGRKATIGELAELGFVDLATRTGLTGAELVRFRRSLFGRTPPPDATAR